MARKSGLGRGLGALIPEKKTKEKIEKNTTEKIEQVQNIKLEKIEPSKDNPRKNFDDESLDSLAESIKLYGIIQPLVLLKSGENYSIVAGERRYRAAKKIGLVEVPAIIKVLNEKDKDMISMVENIQREDLNAYEEALAYRNIMSQYELTQKELSDLLGKSRTYIANIVRLLSLDDSTISELEKGNITSSQGRALLGVTDLLERKKYLDMLVRQEITVNEIEKKSQENKKKPRKLKRDIFLRDIEDKLKESLGTKVVVKKMKNKWKVNIEFTSDEQIEEFLKHYELGE